MISTGIIIFIALLVSLGLLAPWMYLVAARVYSSNTTGNYNLGLFTAGVVIASLYITSSFAFFLISILFLAGTNLNRVVAFCTIVFLFLNLLFAAYMIYYTRMIVSEDRSDSIAARNIETQMGYYLVVYSLFLFLSICIVGGIIFWKRKPSTSSTSSTNTFISDNRCSSEGTCWTTVTDNSEDSRVNDSRINDSRINEGKTEKIIIEETGTQGTQIGTRKRVVNFADDEPLSVKKTVYITKDDNLVW